MCAVSMIGDFYGNKFAPYVSPPLPLQPVVPQINWPVITVLPADFEQLKRDVAEMKELLKRAKDYDERNGEPACEKDEKVAVLKAVAKLVGVDLTEIFGANPPQAS